MRAAHAIPLAVTAVLVSCAHIQPIDTPVQLREESTVDVPFLVMASGTYDIQLQYSKDLVGGVEPTMQRELAGSATLRAGDKKLDWQLPTGWYRVSPFDDTAAGMVLLRFHAYANTRYVLTLHITHLPEELEKVQGVVSVYPVGSHFHPDHHVYELQ
jgi:hypothetical protein